MSIPNVQWRPSPNFNSRDARYPLMGDVSHRIVGSAPSALSLFETPSTPEHLRPSSHFVIGHTGVGDPCPECGPITGARGQLLIWQTVDLCNMAWTNGDVRDPTWAGYQAGVNPNLTTITTEHEDMAAVGHHIVTDHIWRTSMALKKLLRSGDLAAIRAKGIRISDGAFTAAALVKRMAALPISSATYTDHHAISGPNKPWCWRDYDGDKGFPSRLPGLLAYLNGTDDVINDYLRYMERLDNRTARLAVGATARSIPAFDRANYDAHKLFTLAAESTGPAIGWVQGTNLTLADGTVFDARTRWLATWSKGKGIVFWHERDVKELTPTETQTVEVPVPADCSVQEARIIDLEAALTERDSALAAVQPRLDAKNGALDVAIAHEQPHVDLSAQLTQARAA